MVFEESANRCLKGTHRLRSLDARENRFECRKINSKLAVFDRRQEGL
jgi:hypothetical protein